INVIIKFINKLISLRSGDLRKVTWVYKEDTNLNTKVDLIIEKKIKKPLDSDSKIEKVIAVSMNFTRHPVHYILHYTIKGTIQWKYIQPKYFKEGKIFNGKPGSKFEGLLEKDRNFFISNIDYLYTDEKGLTANGWINFYYQKTRRLYEYNSKKKLRRKT
ncbi:hypothetical protein J4471_02510, partial [Candidatus Woesearchaeota archaeon]|nr:hypothetical protein [Candidatus Woesearchaeota archaeon]